MNMDIKSTTEMMCSEDYKERFKAEYYQLLIRYNKLTAMVMKWDVGALEFKPTCPRSIYSIQLDSMKTYLAVLEARAKIEGIDLVQE